MLFRIALLFHKMFAVMFEDLDVAECLPELLPYYPQALRNTL